MRFLGGVYEKEPEEWVLSVEEYANYLKSIWAQLPAEVRGFLSERKSYSENDPRELHSSYAEELSILEVFNDQDGGLPRLDIKVKLLGPLDTWNIFLRYVDVKSYSIVMNSIEHEGIKSPVVQGEWHVDEILLDEKGYDVHEILFKSGAVWRIVCCTIIHSASEIQSQI